MEKKKTKNIHKRKQNKSAEIYSLISEKRCKRRGMVGWLASWLERVGGKTAFFVKKPKMRILDERHTIASVHCFFFIGEKPKMQGAIQQKNAQNIL